MDTKIKIISKILLLIFVVVGILSCSETTNKDEEIRVVEFCKSNNKAIFQSNKMMLNKLFKDTFSNFKLQNIELLERLNEEIFFYFNSFRNDFVFKLENGNNTFFDPDTVRISQLKNWSNEKFIAKYVLLSIDTIYSKNKYLSNCLKKFPSSKYYFYNDKINVIVNGLRKEDNNAFEVLQIIEMIENYYLISVNKVVLKMLKDS